MFRSPRNSYQWMGSDTVLSRCFITEDTPLPKLKESTFPPSTLTVRGPNTSHFTLSSASTSNSEHSNLKIWLRSASSASFPDLQQQQNHTVTDAQAWNGVIDDVMWVKQSVRTHVSPKLLSRHSWSPEDEPRWPSVPPWGRLLCFWMKRLINCSLGELLSL